MKRKYYFLIGFLLLLQLGWGQLNDDYIHGVLLDSETEEPVVFATVRLTGKALGVISDKDGGFQIPLEFQRIGEALEISCMGYESKTISFDVLQRGEVNRVGMTPATFKLQETTVEGRRRRRPTAKQIIRYALHRIPENYDQDAFELTGYYRDYQLKDDNYINLNEGLIRVLDDGFLETDYNQLQFGLLDYATNTNFPIDSFAAKGYDYNRRDKFIPSASFGTTYASNELVLLFIHDAIRNYKIRSYSYIYRFVEDFIKNHQFLEVKTTNYGKSSVYRIKFKRNDIPFQVRGTIYIDVENFAIRKLDYAVYKQEFDKSSPTNYSNLKKNLLYEILVEYKDFENQMYLNYISFHNQFKLVRPPKFYIKEVLVNPVKREMKLYLNKPAANVPYKYSVRYQGKKLRIAGAYQIDASTFGLLFPLKASGQDQWMKQLFQETEDGKKPALELEIKQLKDKEGNALGQSEVHIIDQFREFFTQKVKIESHPISNDSILIHKLRSLGHPLQPKLNDTVNRDFWMNTPLKTNLQNQ